MNTRALFDLTGRVAIVTGGNGGIGRGIAIGLAEAGATVAVFGRNDDKNGRVLEELKAIGARSLAMNVDVTDRDGLEPAFQRVERELGGVDILVNNAGHANLSGSVLLENAADWDRVIETQLNAVFLLSKLGAAAMVKRRRGKIINVGSMYSFFGSGLVPSYSAAKGAVIQLTKSMAIELAPHNVQVNAIAPGWIETEMTAPVRATPMNDEILARTPAGRWGQPDEIGGTAVTWPRTRPTSRRARLFAWMAATRSGFRGLRTVGLARGQRVRQFIGFPQPIGDRRLHLVTVRNVDDVHELRARLALDAAHLRRSHGAAEEDADLQIASSRAHEKVAGVPREHDGGARRVDPLVAELDGGFAQPLPRVRQLVGQILCERRLGRGPAVVRLALLDPLLAVMALVCAHPPHCNYNAARNGDA